MDRCMDGIEVVANALLKNQDCFIKESGVTLHGIASHLRRNLISQKSVEEADAQRRAWYEAGLRQLS